MTLLAADDDVAVAAHYHNDVAGLVEGDDVAAGVAAGVAAVVVQVVAVEVERMIRDQLQLLRLP